VSFRLRDLARGLDREVHEFPGKSINPSARIPTSLKDFDNASWSKIAWNAIEDQMKEETSQH